MGGTWRSTSNPGSQLLLEALAPAAPPPAAPPLLLRGAGRLRLALVCDDGTGGGGGGGGDEADAVDRAAAARYASCAADTCRSSACSIALRRAPAACLPTPGGCSVTMSWPSAPPAGLPLLPLLAAAAGAAGILPGPVPAAAGTAPGPAPAAAAAAGAATGLDASSSSRSMSGSSGSGAATCISGRASGPPAPLRQRPAPSNTAHCAAVGVGRTVTRPAGATASSARTSSSETAPWAIASTACSEQLRRALTRKQMSASSAVKARSRRAWDAGSGRLSGSGGGGPREELMGWMRAEPATKAALVADATVHVDSA